MDEESETASRDIPFNKFCCKELKETEWKLAGKVGRITVCLYAAGNDPVENKYLDNTEQWKDNH